MVGEFTKSGIAVDRFVAMKCKFAKDIYMKGTTVYRLCDALNIINDMLDEFKTLGINPDFNSWAMIVDTINIINALAELDND